MKPNEQALIALENIQLVTIDPLKELYFGISKRTIPWTHCLIPGLVFNILRIFDVDYYLLKAKGALFFYPTSVEANIIYFYIMWTSGFFVWAFWKLYLKSKLTTELTEIFKTAGLKTATGKLPSLIFDFPLDQWIRKMRLKKANLPKQSFDAAKPTLESGLKVFIDEIKENRESGSIDIIYSHHEMPKEVILENFLNLSKDTYFVGNTRARKIECKLSESPHLLIGGQTGGGKSTFLRQLITSLYITNPTYKFVLIDLKAGLEFQIFEKLKRAEVIPNAKGAMDVLSRLEKKLNYRLEALKMHKVKDLTDYLKLSSEKKVDTSRLPDSESDMARLVIVIDEAAELFLAGELAKTKEVQEAKRIVQRISAQGRAAGIHLVIATQKPDAKAVDTHIKTNLTSIVSFQMPNLGSSMSILSNGRAADLPKIPGRAIWKQGLDMVEVQTPYMSYESTELILEKKREHEKT